MQALASGYVECALGLQGFFLHRRAFCRRIRKTGVLDSPFHFVRFSRKGLHPKRLTKAVQVHPIKEQIGIRRLAPGGLQVGCGLIFTVI